MSLLLLFSSSPAKYSFAQARASIKQTYYVHAQAQAEILAPTKQKFGQAQANIFSIVNAHAQTQADIKQTNQIFAQANAYIKLVLQNYAQAQALLIWRFGLAQAQTYIRLPRLITSQAQGYIFVTPVPTRAIISVTISVNKNGLRNTSRYTIGNAAWEMMPDGKRIWWRADFDSEDILIVDKED